MKQIRSEIAVVLILVSVAFACSKSSNSSNTSCTATTGDTGPLSNNKQVLYTATVTMGATINNLSYQDSAGTTIVKNPVLPFTKTVNLQAGQTVTISATGTANTGEITVTSNGINLNNASCP
jgi:hypothetical protein